MSIIADPDLEVKSRSIIEDDDGPGLIRPPCYLATAAEDLIEVSAPLEAFIRAVLSWEEAADMALWHEMGDGRPPRLIGYVRPDAKGKARVTWL